MYQDYKISKIKTNNETIVKVRYFEGEYNKDDNYIRTKKIKSEIIHLTKDVSDDEIINYLNEKLVKEQINPISIQKDYVKTKRTIEKV
jgi:hypothetical protein